MKLTAGALLVLTFIYPFAPQDLPPEFFADVLPILQQHCQSCHRPREIGPIPLLTYEDARSNADAMRRVVRERQMPPWFADPRFGRFANDRSLTAQQIETIVLWADAGAPAGDRGDAPQPLPWVPGWSIRELDQTMEMPEAVIIPADGDIEYTYEILHTGFTEDQWIQMAELRPSSREHVHHAVIYIRPPDSTWLRNAPVGVPFTASKLDDEQARRDAHWTDSDMLLVYAPGSSPDEWPDGMAKLIPAGSDLVFQMHYSTNGRSAVDRTRLGLVFAKETPVDRVLTLQLTNDRFIIPPGVDDYRVEAWGTLPNDAALLSFFPHMHLRGKRFEYNIVHDAGHVETLLRVDYHYHWQFSYRLAEPLHLRAGTRLQAVAWYDNSSNNPHNPAPERAVTWGDQAHEEMMVGFFDVAVPRDVDKWKYFERN